MFCMGHIVELDLMQYAVVRSDSSGPAQQRMKRRRTLHVNCRQTLRASTQVMASTAEPSFKPLHNWHSPWYVADI
jgi:hypothetical protein